MYDAIVLAGGSGRRLGGVDKAAVEVGGTALLDRVLSAVLGTAHHVVVVGPPRSLPAGAVGTSEQPAGGGPVAALAAGLALVDAPVVVVLACDLPFIRATTVSLLVAALGNQANALTADGVALVDDSGRRQTLTAAYRTARLRAAVAGLDAVHGTPMHAVVGELTMLDVAAPSGQAVDCDTWDDVRRARSRAEAHPGEEP